MDADAARDRMARITGIAAGFQEAAALLAANALGVFPALGEKWRTGDEVAEVLGAPARGVRMLLDALCAMELLRKEGGRYANTADTLAFLVPGGPFYAGDMLRHNAGLYERFGRLAEAVRTGAPPPRPPGGRTAAQQRDFILAMANIGAVSARQLMPLLRLAGTERILDVGGGPGTYLQVLCEAHPGVTGVLFDLPETTAIAREYLAGRPGADRIEIRDGDYFEDGFGSGFDGALVSNVIHSLGPDDIRMVFRRCAACLRPAGRVWVKDFLLEADRTAPRYAAVFALNMFLGTKAGSSYAFGEVEGWLAEAGFDRFRRERITEHSALVEGRRSG